MDLKFYKCKHCGQIVAIVKNSNVPIICCGEAMSEIIAGEVDAAEEKHVPTFSIDSNIVTVNVGSVDHPMEDKHYIEWIAIQTKNGNQRVCLSPGSKPRAQFALMDGDEVELVCAYCNLHGLWKK